MVDSYKDCGCVLDSQTIKRSGDAVCDLHRAQGDKERGFPSLASKTMVTVSPGLTSKPVASSFSVWASKPRSSHQTVVQWIFRYLKYTFEFGIWYLASSSLDLVGFSDADFAGCGIDQKSTSGTCHFIGSSLVCLLPHKLSSIAQSSIESEYVATASCCSQIFWIVHTMRDYGVTYKSVPLMCDNSSAICLTQNPVFHGRTKYIKVRHHFSRDQVEKGEIVMKYINTKRQLANIFTKPLDASRFATLRGVLGVGHPYRLVWGGAYALFCIYSILFFIALHLFIST
jgi:hypothetical protein